MANFEELILKPVGRVNTGYRSLAECPSTGHSNPNASILELDGEFADGLLNIELATHLIVLYWFERSDRSALFRRTHPEEIKRGVFASRSPNRPNPIALSVVELLACEDNRLRVSGLDCLDGTAIIDIKIYDPQTDCVPNARLDFKSKCHETACGCHAAQSTQNKEN